MPFRTINGERKDLIPAIKQRANPPVGYIGGRIFPVTSAVDKSGSFYVKTLAADTAAETSRSAGSAPSATVLATTAKTFLAAEYIKRYGVTEDEAKEMGSIESADVLGGTAAMRSVWRAFEDIAAGKVISSGGYAAATRATTGKVLASIQYLAISVRLYPGKTCLVCSEDWYLDLISQSDVMTAIQATWGNANLPSLLASFGSAPEAMLNMMATVLKVDEILVGDNAHWKVSARQDAAAIMRLPDAAIAQSQDEMRMLYKLDPIYGVSKFFMPDPADKDNLFKLESFWDDNDKLNKYDAAAWFDCIELNSGAKKIIKLPTNTWATTTTTSGG